LPSATARWSDVTHTPSRQTPARRPAKSNGNLKAGVTTRHNLGQVGRRQAEHTRCLQVGAGLDKRPDHGRTPSEDRSLKRRKRVTDALRRRVGATAQKNPGHLSVTCTRRAMERRNPHPILACPRVHRSTSADQELNYSRLVSAGTQCKRSPSFRVPRIGIGTSFQQDAHGSDTPALGRVVQRSVPTSVPTDRDFGTRVDQQSEYSPAPDTRRHHRRGPPVLIPDIERSAGGDHAPHLVRHR
jgi:hypothetical protein